MASIVSNTSSSSSKRTLEKVNGAMENGASKKSKIEPTKITKKEMRAMVKKFVDYYESMKHKSVQDESCDDKKELERRVEAMRMLLTLWGTKGYVDGEVPFSEKDIEKNYSDHVLEDTVIGECMEVAEGLEWIDENDDENKFTIDFTSLFEALPGYLNLVASHSRWQRLPSVKSVIDRVPDSLKKDNPFYELLAAWDQAPMPWGNNSTPWPQALNELVDLAVHYIALGSGDIESGLIRALKDDKFKCGGGFTIVDRDLVFYHSVEKYKVGAYHISKADYDKDEYSSSDSDDDEYDSDGEPINKDKDDEENANLKEENAKLEKKLAEARETHAKLVKEHAKMTREYEESIAKLQK